MDQRYRTLIKLFGVATIAALGLRLLFIEDYRIASDSMSPNLLTGDLVFVSKIAFNIRLPFSTYEVVKFARPKRSDIVAFSLPERGIETFVKRVVALGGDKVEIREGVLYINGTVASYQPIQLDRQIAEEAAGKYSKEKASGERDYTIHLDERKDSHYGPVDIPKDHFFALGDNRLDSVDSRVWGPIPYSCLKGKVELVWLSLNPLGEMRQGRTWTWLN